MLLYSNMLIKMIWKALNDPTRRSILTLLKQAPHTTGEISQQYGHLSRYAIMKHLAVLEEAQLIYSRRKGKYRWNYLNAQAPPIGEAAWALGDLKAFTGENMGKRNRPGVASFKRSTAASPQKVWNHLTNSPLVWWPVKLYQHQRTVEVRMEALPGGKLYEQIEGTDGHLIAWVTALEEGLSIEFLELIRTSHGLLQATVDLKIEVIGPRTQLSWQGKMNDNGELALLRKRWEQLISALLG